MEFASAAGYLETLGLELRPGRKFDLAHMRALTAALGRRERGLRAVHIAGTNGKGSTAALIEAAARAAGIPTGLTTSPHLERVSERIRIDGKEIGEAAFARAAAQVRAAAEHLLAEDHLPHPPSFFEAVTAMAFLALAERPEAAEALAVIEVGLGGRLDATNVIAPEVAVITPIGLDHEAYLGPSIEAIAEEKAGIIKAGIAAVVTAEQTPAAIEVLRRRCAANGVPLIESASRPARQAERQADGTYRFEIDYGGETLALHPGLRGRHQIGNAITAALACEQLRRLGWPLEAAALREGFERVRWPGRLERIGERPDIFLDGAHNPLAAQALGAFLDDRRADGAPAPILIYGSMRDKAIEEICETLFPRARAVILTAPAQARALAPAALAAACGPYAPACETAADYPAALARARELAGTAIPIYVTGSLYLVGEARHYGAGAAE